MLKKKEKNDNKPFMLVLVTLMFWFAQYSFTPYINPELERMGASYTLIGLSGTVYGLFQMIGRLPFGLFSAKMGQQKPFIMMGCVLAFVACLGMFFIYQPVSIVALRGIQGLASASWVSFTVLYGSYFGKDTGKHVALLDMAASVGKLFCFIVGMLLVQHLSCKATLISGALFACGALFLTQKVTEKEQAPLKISYKNLKSIVKSKHLLYCSVLAMLSQFVLCATCFSFTQNLMTRLRADNAQLTFVNIVLLCATVFFNLLANKVLYKRMHNAHIITIGFLASALYCIVAPFATSIILLYVLQILPAATISMSLAVLLGESIKEVLPKNRAISMTFFQVVFSIGMTLGPLAMGVMVDFTSLNGGFLLMGAVALLSAFLTIKMLYTKDRTAA